MARYKNNAEVLAALNAQARWFQSDGTPMDPPEVISPTPVQDTAADDGVVIQEPAPTEGDSIPDASGETPADLGGNDAEPQAAAEEAMTTEGQATEEASGDSEAPEAPATESIVRRHPSIRNHSIAPTYRRTWS